MSKLQAGPHYNQGAIQAFPLSEAEKNAPALLQEFARAARKFAGRLATSGERSTKRKNRQLAFAFITQITNAPYDVFSLLAPQQRGDAAFERRNLVFKLRAYRHADEERETWKFAKDGGVTIAAPVCHLSLPRDENGASYIPVSSVARITLPLSPQTMAATGGPTGRKLAGIATGHKPAPRPEAVAVPPPAKCKREKRRHKHRTRRATTFCAP